MDFITRLREAGKKHQINWINCIPFAEIEGFSSVVVALLPYYAGEQPSYLSKYTRGLDYHQVGRKILEQVIEEIGQPIKYQIFIDVSPLNEIELALRAGLGVRGKNNLLINEEYGSFVFIITALTDQVVPNFEAPTASCLKCGLCQKSCPYGAIGLNGINYEKCISHISQKRQITKAEEAMLQGAGFAWGCDLCQDCCPHNKNVPLTPILEFKENLLTTLEDLNQLSNRDFQKIYRPYALSYKGKKILQRNINLLQMPKV